MPNKSNQRDDFIEFPNRIIRLSLRLQLAKPATQRAEKLAECKWNYAKLGPVKLLSFNQKFRADLDNANTWCIEDVLNIYGGNH